MTQFEGVLEMKFSFDEKDKKALHALFRELAMSCDKVADAFEVEHVCKNPADDE